MPIDGPRTNVLRQERRYNYVAVTETMVFREKDRIVTRQSLVRFS